MNIYRKFNTNIGFLAAPLCIIFIEQFAGNLFTPGLVKMVGQEQHILSASLPLEWRNFLLGLAMGIGSLTGIFTTPIFLSLSDTLGRKKTLLATLCLHLVGLVLPIIAIYYHSFIFVIISNCLAVGTATRVLAKTAIVDMSVGVKRKLFLGFATIAKDSPSIIAPIVGALLINAYYFGQHSIEIPYFLGIFLTLVNLFVVITFFKEPEHHYDLTHKKVMVNIFKIWRQIYHEPCAIKPLLGFFFFEFSFALFNHDIPLFWHGYLHISIIQMSAYFSYNGLIITLGLLFIYPLWLKWVPERFQLSLPVIIMAISFVGIAFLPGTISRLIMTIPAVLCAAISYPQFLALITSSVSEDKHGWALGIVYMIVGLVWFCSAILMAGLDALSVYMPLFICGLSTYASFFVIYRISGRTRLV